MSTPCAQQAQQAQGARAEDGVPARVSSDLGRMRAGGTTVKPHAAKGDYEAAFKGFHYPISRAAVLTSGRDKGGLDREVGYVLALLPERRYNTEDELREAVRAVYRSQGVDEGALPL